MRDSWSQRGSNLTFVAHEDFALGVRRSCCGKNLKFSDAPLFRPFSPTDNNWLASIELLKTQSNRQQNRENFEWIVHAHKCSIQLEMLSKTWLKKA